MLRRHVNGDNDAFGALFSRHKDRLWAVAVRTMGDPEEAADALQDAMISAFRQASGFRGDSAVTTWLHRIVVNACLDRLRRRAARPAVGGLDERVMDALAPTSMPGADEVTSTGLDVMAALRTLAPEQQAVLVLVDMMGYPVAETAGILGISPGTVKSRCARARARLLPRLAHLRGGTGGADAPMSPAGAGGPGPGGAAASGDTGTGPPGPGRIPAPVQNGPQERNQAATGRVSPAEGGGESGL